MEDVTLKSAKARLSELAERAASGGPIRITKRGKPVAQLLGVEKRCKPVDLAALQALTESMPMQPEAVGDWLRALRDDQRC